MEQESLLSLIREKYPTGGARISQSFGRDIIEKAMVLSRDYPGVQRKLLHARLVDLYEVLHKDPITAAQLHERLDDIFERHNSGPSPRDSEEAVARLGRQLRDLRSLVTSPSAVENRIKELEGQIDGLREDIGIAQTAAAGKQEDVLQKFLASDRKAFIVMPFLSEFNNVWIGGIRPACTECHYVPLRVDEVSLSSLITDDIEKYSTMADVVVVDLTGNNPNVMFELGWALAKNKKPIVICQGEHSSKVAFDVRGIRHISYENSWLGVEALKKKLKEFIPTTEQQAGPKSTKKQPKKLGKGSAST